MRVNIFTHPPYYKRDFHGLSYGSAQCLFLTTLQILQFLFVIINFLFVYNNSSIFVQYYSLKLVRIINQLAIIFKPFYSWLWIFFKPMTKIRQIIVSDSNGIILWKII